MARASAPASVSIELDNLDAGLASLRALGIGVWLNNFGCEGIDDESAAVAVERGCREVRDGTPRVGTNPTHRAGPRLHDHGKVVLVEGVESAAHERLAVETGVDLASGYRYAPSMTEPEFVEYLD